MEKLEYADQVSFYTNVIKLQMRIRKETMKLLYSSSKSMFSAIIAAVKTSASMSAKDTSYADDDARIDTVKNYGRAETLSESFFLASDISDEEIFNESSDDSFLDMDFSS